MLLAFVVTVTFFWPTLASFPTVWLADSFSHSWFVVALTAWLAWRHRGRFEMTGGGIDPWLMALLLGLSLLWLVTFIANVRAGHQALLVVLLAGWAIATFGRRTATVVLYIGATFLLAVPIWGALVPVLRTLTILMSGLLVTLTRVPAEIDGDLILIESGAFLVEDGCAGLNYLLAALVLGAAYGHLLLNGSRARLAVLGLATCVAIAGNWIRVAALVVIGHVSQMQSGIIQDHLWLGWVIFSIGLVPFFVIARRIERADRATRDPEETRPALTDPDPTRGAAATTRRAVAATTMAVVGPLVYLGVSSLPAAGSGGANQTDFSSVESWQTVRNGDERPFTWQPLYQEAAEHRVATFSRDGDRVHLDQLTFRDQTGGAELIGPHTRIAPSSMLLRERVAPVPGLSGRWVRQAILRAPESPVLVWYWFRVGGVETFSPLRAKLLEIPAFFRRIRVAELIAVSTACDVDDCAHASSVMLSFVQATMAQGRPPSSL